MNRIHFHIYIRHNNLEKTMKRTFLYLIILLLVSCQKENDVFNYSLTYESPTPYNEEQEVPFRFGKIGFSNFGKGGLGFYTKEYRLYLDTQNPPKNIFSSSQYDSYINYTYTKLAPSTTYYWAYSTFIPAGEIMSEVQTFTTIGFYGDWQLDSIADKKGILERAKANELTVSFVDWGAWDNNSYKYMPNAEYNKQIINYKVNMDSVLSAENDITTISFYSENTVRVKKYNDKNTSLLYCSFQYDIKLGSFMLKETELKTEHNFVALYMGYLDIYRKKVLLLLKENGMLYIYSRK